jgi:hypothetical protein
MSSKTSVRMLIFFFLNIIGVTGARKVLPRYRCNQYKRYDNLFDHLLRYSMLLKVVMKP